MNRYEKALDYYDSAIQKNSEDPDYYNNKGLIKFHTYSWYSRENE